LKSKVLLSIFVILLILGLASCEVVPPGLPAWMRAEEAVYQYWVAIINRQHELAKWFCIIGGVWYNKTDEWEEYIVTNSEGEASVVIYLPSFYEQAEAIGNNAVVYARITVSKIAFPGSCVIYGDTFEYEMELIKETFPPGDWKLK